MVRQIRVSDQRSDSQSAVAGGLNCVQRQTCDVHKMRWCFDVQFHQVDERGTAGDESVFRAGIYRRVLERRVDVSRFYIIKSFQQTDLKENCLLYAYDLTESRTCLMAERIFWYAPQRQILPLIASLISALVLPQPSFIKAVADII